MASYKKRVTEQIDLHGEDFLVNGTAAAKGFFMLMDLTRLNTYFNSYEQAGLTKPALSLQVAADTSLEIDDTVDRDGRTYTVARLTQYRIHGEIVLQTAVLT